MERKLEALQCEVENIVSRAGLNGHSLSSLQAKKKVAWRKKSYQDLWNGSRDPNSSHSSVNQS